MTLPVVVAGDVWEGTATLESNGVAYTIPAGSTAKAAIVSEDNETLLSGPVDIPEADPDNDWPNGIVAFKFATTDTASLENGRAKLEVEVTTLNKPITWFGLIETVKGLIA